MIRTVGVFTKCQAPGGLLNIPFVLGNLKVKPLPKKLSWVLERVSEASSEPLLRPRHVDRMHTNEYF